MPKFSIVIPVYKTPERYLKEMLDSILAQTYAKWEVCVADGSPRGESVERVLRRYAEKDRRFKYVILGENKGISGNTNAAIDMADGDFIVLADHDDMMTPDALYECAKKINENPEFDVFFLQHFGNIADHVLDLFIPHRLFFFNQMRDLIVFLAVEIVKAEILQFVFDLTDT